MNFSYSFVLKQDALQTADGEVCLLGLLIAHLQVLGQGQHGGDGVLGDGRGGVAGDATDPNASLLAEVHGDVVEARRAAENELVAVRLEDFDLGGLDLLVDKDADGLEAGGLGQHVIGNSVEASGNL